MSDPDYIVIRDPEAPSVSGRWYDRAGFLDEDDRPRLPAVPGAEVVRYAPTPFIEVRDSDGAVAQVWMRTPGSAAGA